MLNAMQQQNKIEFEAKPTEINFTRSRGELGIMNMTLVGNRQSKISLSLSDKEIEKLFPDYSQEPIYSRYRITIENITEQQKPHELLQIAATSAKLGNVKLAVEQAIKAMQKLAE